MKTIILNDAIATKNFGKKLGESLPPNTVILLEGDLGAGKTTLIQGIGEGLGINEPIVSPTFTLINEYYDGRLPLYHFDLYRLEGDQVNEISPETYWEGIEVEAGITAIEWSERLTYKPSNYLKINLANYSQNKRKVELLIVGKLDFNLDQFN